MNSYSAMQSRIWNRIQSAQHERDINAVKATGAGLFTLGAIALAEQPNIHNAQDLVTVAVGGLSLACSITFGLIARENSREVRQLEQQSRQLQQDFVAGNFDPAQFSANFLPQTED